MKVRKYSIREEPIRHTDLHNCLVHRILRIISHLRALVSLWRIIQTRPFFYQWRFVLFSFASIAVMIIFISFGRIPGDSILDRPTDLTIVHLSDIHLSSRTNACVETPWTHKIIIKGYKLHQPCLGKTISLFEQAIGAINTRIHPDVVVITGDTVNSATDAAAFKKASELVKKINCPVIVTDGDHDPADQEGSLFRKYFGSSDGESLVKGVPFFFIPCKSNKDTLRRLEERISTSQSSRYKILCMHRMLRASVLMMQLSKKYVSTILSPNRELILNILEKSKNATFLVLCGHSHTNYEKMDNNVFHICTASLAEYPHEMRVVKIIGDRIETRVFPLAGFQPDEKHVDRFTQ